MIPFLDINAINFFALTKGTINYHKIFNHKWHNRLWHCGQNSRNLTLEDTGSNPVFGIFIKHLFVINCK